MEENTLKWQASDMRKAKDTLLKYFKQVTAYKGHEVSLLKARGCLTQWNKGNSGQALV